MTSSEGKKEASATGSRRKRVEYRSLARREKKPAKVLEKGDLRSPPKKAAVGEKKERYFLARNNRKICGSDHA